MAAYEREESEKKNGNKTSGERLGKCVELVEKIIQKDYCLDLFIKMNRYIYQL